MGDKVKQKEYFGIGSIVNLSEILIEQKPKRIFVVCGRFSYKLSGADEAISPILKPYNVTYFSDFSPNPKLEDIKRGIELFRKKDYDLVIAVGGGSSIDMAKAINTFAFQQNKPEVYLNKKESLQNNGKPIIAIPTTLGTGSEATHFAVIYVDKIKYSLANKDFILPDYAIIDPQFTMNLPPEVTASTGTDALCQAIEAYWSNNSTEESKGYAKEAIKLIITNIEHAVKNPDKESITVMARAANLAGKAINISETTAAHAISYPITSFFGVPHGHAVALTIGSMIVFNSGVTEKDNMDKRGVDYVKKTIYEVIKLLGASRAEEAKGIIENLMQEIGLETKLNKLGICYNADIELIIKNGFNPDRMKNNPRQLNAQQLRQILMGLSKEAKIETVYVGMVADGLHHGHVNIIQEARKYGKVIVGLLTDKAVESYRKKPTLKYEKRKKIIESIKDVDMVVPQETVDYVHNIEKYKPSIVLHGDDWRKGIQKEIRQRAKEALDKYGGRIIEVPYTKEMATAEYVKKRKKFK